ncbi:MAG: hypothetical protein DIU79_08990 [Actinobacteria bacterium]|nr:MAG: hypothetical protein DIU79_08990 [Actinomycetota bacterium]
MAERRDDPERAIPAVLKRAFSRARLAVAGHAARRAARSTAARVVRNVLAVIVIALAGVLIGVLLGAHTRADIGPFNATMRFRPSPMGLSL